MRINYNPLKAISIVFLTLNFGILSMAQYTLTDDDVVVTDGIIQSCSYDFTIKDITIPAILDGQAVTGIASTADQPGIFQGKGITVLELPATIVNIGAYAFMANSLTNIDLSACPVLEVIGECAFASNSINSIDFSGCGSLASIEGAAFWFNVLTDLDLSSCIVLSRIGLGAFQSNALDSLDLSVCPMLTTIEGYAFMNNDLEYLRLGNMLSSIGENAFAFNSLTSIDFSECLSLITIGYRAFFTNSLTSVDINPCKALVTIDEEAFTDNALASLDLTGCSSLKTIGKKAFSNNHLSNINLSGCGALKTIWDFAFGYNYAPITTVNLNGCSSLTYIGDNAFIYNSLYNIDLSTCTALTYIGRGAFIENDLTGFVLPVHALYSGYGWLDGNGVSFDGGDMVNNLLLSYRIPASYTLIDDDVEVIDGIIQTCSYNFALKDIIIPDTLDGQAIIGFTDEGSPRGLFRLKGITSLVLPSSLQTISDCSFYYNNITNLDISNCTSLSYIGNKSFEMNIIKNLNFSACSALKSIGEEAFYYNYSLTSIDFSNCSNLTTIENSAFSNDSISSLDLSDCISLQYIGKQAFQENIITSIDFSNCTVLDTIDNYAFRGNSLLQVDLNSCTGMRYIGTGAFDQNDLTEFYLPTPAGEGIPFAYWIDGNGNTYLGGNEASDLTTSYSAFFSNVYSVHFNVTDGANPVEGAEILLTGYSEVTTDNTGQAIIEGVIPVNNIPYTVIASGYQQSTGTVTVVDSDIAENIILQAVIENSLVTRYDIKIFPNPAKEKIIIEGLPGRGQLSIYDLNGNIFFGKVIVSRNETIDISSWPEGVYQIVFNDEFDFTSRFMKY